VTSSIDSSDIRQAYAASSHHLFPIPVSQWESQGIAWPTTHGWYNLLRPENQRDELIQAGVASFVNGRWVIFPDKWQLYCASHHNPRTA